MKYKCIAKCFIEDSIIMNPGDIVVINGDKLFNITTGVDYRNIPDIERFKSCVEEITEGQTVEYCSTVPTSKTDADRFKDITKIMSDIFIRKNHDYGNSFEQSLNEEGITASRIRMGDKWNRYKQLSKGVKAQVNDESIKDTLIDKATYAIMTIMWLDKQ